VTGETVRADAIPTGLPGHSPPGTPSNLTVVGVQQVDETWDAILDWSTPTGQVDGYHLYKAQFEEFGDCRSPQPYYIGTTTSTTFTDPDVPSQVPIYYQLRAYNATGVSSDAEIVLNVTPTNVEEIEVFQDYSLSAVSGGAPVRFEFNMPSATRAEVVVYDVRGRHLVTLYDGMADLGTHEILWNGRDQAGLKIGSGVYFARLYSRAYGLTSIKFVLAR